MSIFSKLWSGVKSVGKGIWNAFTGDGSSNAWSSLAGLGSSALNYASSSKGIKEQYKYNTLLQKQAQQWSTGMASTAHQLEVNDMRKAGLNPILSATGGSGASAPSASGGSVGMPDYNFGDGISTALAYKESRSVRRQREFQNDLTNAQTGTEIERHNTQEEETDLLHKQQSYIDKQMEDIDNQIQNRNATTAAMIGRYKTMNDVDKVNAESNRVSASAAAHRSNVEAIGIDYDNKKRANDARYYGSGIGKRTQMAKELIKNIPFIGKFAY